MKIYFDNTDQIIYLQLPTSDGSDFYEGVSDGVSLAGGKLVIQEYKKALPVTVNPALITWNLASKLWRIKVPNQNITQFGSMNISISGTNIFTRVVDVEVGYSDDALLTALMNISVRSGRSVKDILRILDIVFTGTVEVVIPDYSVFIGADRSTISVTGDNIGNRSNVEVDLL